MARPSTLKASSALKSAPAIIDPPANHNEQVANLEDAKVAMVDLGNAVRLAEQGVLDAAAADKATKADSMLAFAKYAAAGFITNANFDEWFIMWRYPAGSNVSAIEFRHRSAASNFRSVVAATIEQKSKGRDFVPAIEALKSKVAAMAAAHKADKKAPKPIQADQAVYALANMARTRKVDDVVVPAKVVDPTSPLLDVAAVPKKPAAVVAVDPMTAALDAILASVQLFIDPAAAKKAGVELPEKAWRQRFVEVSNLVNSFKADMIEDEADEDEAVDA